MSAQSPVQCFSCDCPGPVRSMYEVELLPKAWLGIKASMSPINALMPIRECYTLKLGVKDKSQSDELLDNLGSTVAIILILDILDSLQNRRKWIKGYRRRNT
jgi:hypothetical protein